MAMTSRDEKSVAVVGAGLVGSLQAILMAKRGFHVDLFESRPDMRSHPELGGRSINLALSLRGREALGAAGVEEEVVAMAVPMHGRMIHFLSGKMSAQAYGKKGQCVYSIDRRKLNELLLNKAEETGKISLHFEHRLTRANLEKNTLFFDAMSSAEGEGGEKEGESVKIPKEVKTDFVFGCDGAFSTVRRQMMRYGRLDYSQEYIPHGYKELTMPPNKAGGYALPPNYLHIWPRQEFMMIALPNKDCSFTVTLFMPFDKFNSIETEEDLLEFFMNHFSDAVTHIGVEFLVKEYFHNPTGSLISVKCRPHCMHNSTLILGDAAHAVVPFYGQGMNAGFEDCLVYHDYLESFDNNLAKAGAQYSETRWKDAHAIADLSMYNYLEMRSHVTSRFFLFRKYIDNALNRMFPRSFVPLYSMVAFSRIPYHEVVERSSRQTRLVSYSLSAVGLCSFGLGGYLLLRGCGWPPSKILFKLALLVVAYNVKEKVEDLLHIDI